MEKEERGRILTDVADNLGVSESEALSQFRKQARNRQREKEPLVCCVMLTKDRPQMLGRAIACFRAQTYKRARLVVYDVSESPSLPESRELDVGIFHAPDQNLRAIGPLRNRVAKSVSGAYGPPDIFVHWDDDDWSHPERIAEQVALLQASGKECVGYREMLFWDTRMEDPSGGCVPQRAWLYSNGNPRYCLGTSLCYWRSVWERRPFEDKQWGEDTAWLLGVDSQGYQSLSSDIWRYGMGTRYEPGQPRMIASIHGGNTSPAYRGELMRASEKQGGEWKRAPQWDDYARGIMEAK